MSSEWDDGGEEFPAEQPNESEGLKNLRKAHERQKKQNEDLKAQLAALAARDRERTLGDVLRSKGLNTKLAKFYPAGEEASEEKIDGWLKDNADVFGQSSATPQASNDQIPQELRDAFEQFQRPLGSGPGEDFISQIKNFEIKDENDMQKFIAFMRQHPEGIPNRG